MNPVLRSILFGIGVLALVAGVVVGAIWLRGGATSSAQKPAEEKPMVLVAARPIDAGTLLRRQDMVWRIVATSRPQPNSFVRGVNTETELIGSLARRNLAEGEVLTSTALLRPDERGFLAATLVPGFRAVTIPVDASQSASGLVLPGDRVDVILVQKIDGVAPARKSVGETVLANSRVVAVGQTLGPAQKGPPRKTSALSAGEAQSSEKTPPQTITLEATPLEAERIFVAGQIGTLELALRPLGEPATVAPPEIPVWAGDVSAALEIVPPQPPAPGRMSVAERPRAASPAGGPPAVLIIRGSGGNQK